MRIGLLLSLFVGRKLEELLPYIASKGIGAAELYVGPLSDDKNHCDPNFLLSDHNALRKYKKLFSDNGIIISAVNASGNPVHPKKNVARAHDESFKRGIRLAEALEVERVLNFSGCPGGGPDDETPNWICCPWPEEFLAMLSYQWEEVLIPYWTETAAFAKSHGIKKIGLEMHPGFCVYNPETLLKLRERVGEVIGANLDPSHLCWQGVDMRMAVKTLKGAIHHVHVKDVRVNEDVVKRSGVIDAKHYSELSGRAWTFTTAGYGHGALEWKGFVNELRVSGYDFVLSIEHEDANMGRAEGFEKGLDFLKSVIINDPPEKMWWA